MDDDNLIAEYAALKRKLQSKAEALAILARDLDTCKRERDHFKCVADMKSRDKLKVRDEFEFIELPVKSECHEVDDLKRKLKVAQDELKRLKSAEGPSHQKEKLVAEVEESKKKIKELESDLQSVFDEKEELVTERDAYRCKVHRLNHEIQVLLKSDSHLDVDSLVMENKYLKERLDQTLAEKEMVQQALSKYKTMLDSKRTKGVVRLGTNTTCGGMVVTHKQGPKVSLIDVFSYQEMNLFTVQELLENDGTLWKSPYNAEATLADLRSLSLALLEALQDKVLALAHQRKTNKILAERVTTLESRLTKDEKPVYPSQLLLEGYSGSQVDKDLTDSVLQEFKEFRKENEEMAKPKETTEEVKNLEDDGLPPELQELVLKAIEEISLDAV